jgi:hypothetical protein
MIAQTINPTGNSHHAASNPAATAIPNVARFIRSVKALIQGDRIATSIFHVHVGNSHPGFDEILNPISQLLL